MKRMATLLGYIQSQQQEFEAILASMRKKTPETGEDAVYIGYMLHNLYCALEDLFKRVADTFENNVDDLSRYHRDLLRRMSFDVPGVRPRLLSSQSFSGLDELRRFRHLFRHAYTYQLDPRKVGTLRTEILQAWTMVENDINTFTIFLRSILENTEE